MNGTRSKDGNARKIETGRAPSIAEEIKTKRFDADRLFTKLGGFVPPDEQKNFVEWLNDHPRAMENLAKGILTTGELNAAYQQYVKETKSGEEVKKNALARINPQQFAAMISVPQEKVEKLLDLYNPDYLKSLAILSQKCESDFETAAEVDEILLDDGSYIDRLEETKEVVLAYEALKKAINSDLAAAESLAAKRMHDVSLDKLWDYLLEEFEGDATKAAEVYAKEAADRLGGIKTRPFEPVELDKQLVVEIYKLLNYNAEDLDVVVQYAVHNINVISRDDAEQALLKAVAESIDKMEGVVLNERSVFYGRVGEAGKREKERTEVKETEKETKPKGEEPEGEPDMEDADEETDNDSERLNNGEEEDEY